MSDNDNEEVSLIRKKMPKKETQVENPVEMSSEPKVKKQRPPKTEKQLEASKKMLEARRLQVQRIKEEKLAKQYEAYRKKETSTKCVVPPPHATVGQVSCQKTIAQPPIEAEEEDEEEEEEEEIIVIKKPKTKPKPKKKIVIVQQSDSEEESEDEDQPRQPVTKPKIKQDFGKSQQNSKSKINVGNQNRNWDNYFC
jgi:hypothetical protein